MKKSFVELLNEIVNDFKQIHINSKKDVYKEIDVFSKISELLRLAEEVENYTTNNLNIIEKIFTLCFTYFNDEIGIIWGKNEDNNDEILKYYSFKYYRIETILQNFIYDNELQIKFYKLDVFEFEKQCSHILKNTSSVNKNTQTIKQELTFVGLFKIPHNEPKKQKELKDLLKRNGYIDEDNKWEVTTCNKNEIAFLYDLFDDKKILTPGSFAQKIKTFYKEFGLIVYNDNEPATGGYCTLKNLRTTRVKNNDTYQNFEIIFSNWVK